MKQKQKISEEYIRKLFGVNLRKRLIDNDMTQADLAEAVGTSPIVVTRWCHGTAIPQPRMFATICTAIGARPQDLLAERVG